MRILSSFLSIIMTLLILVTCASLDLILSKDAIIAGLDLIGKNNFNFNIILLGFSLVFFCTFVIIFLMSRKNSKYFMSSILASAISIIFFTLFFGSFDIVKNFYFASNEFSALVKGCFTNIFIANFSISLLLILFMIIYFIRRRKNEKKH